MLDNLVIGSSSQLAQYMPKEYIKISSRNINIKNLKNNVYNRIFLCFGEQRTCEQSIDKEFININFDYTLLLIDNLKNYCNSIIVYSTADLWNKINGPIDLTIPYSYEETPYIRSKFMLCNEINRNRSYFDNICIIYPFNFNSIHRKYNNLFGKIFYSILHKSKIELGDIDFYRDIIHTNTVCDMSIICNQDTIVGSGQLIHIYQFIKDLYQRLNLNMNEYIYINKNLYQSKNKPRHFSAISYSNYSEIMHYTLQEIQNYVN